LDPSKKSRRGGIGLANIRERLENLYGDDNNFSLRNAEEGGLLASITIPFSTEPVMTTNAAI
jgi:sensor histidine kinase YesM